MPPWGVLLLLMMLTRSAVAKRIQRSVATVRRLEGNELFPQLDERGVHRFEEAEVEEVRQQLQLGTVHAARGRWLNGSRAPRDRGQSKESGLLASIGLEPSEVEHLRGENRRLTAELAEAHEQLGELCLELEQLDLC